MAPKMGVFGTPRKRGVFGGGTANSISAHVRNRCFLHTPENTCFVHIPETGDFWEIVYFHNVRKRTPSGMGILSGISMCIMELPGRRRNFDQSYGWGVGEIPV